MKRSRKVPSQQIKESLKFTPNQSLHSPSLQQSYPHLYPQVSQPLHPNSRPLYTSSTIHVSTISSNGNIRAQKFPFSFLRQTIQHEVYEAFFSTINTRTRPPESLSGRFFWEGSLLDGIGAVTIFP